MMGLLRLVSKRTVVKAIGAYTVLLLVYKLLRMLLWYRRRYKFFQNIQGVEDFNWQYGNLHMLPREFEKRAKVELEWMKKYPKFHRLWMGPITPIIRVYHPETIKCVAKSSEPKPLGFGGAYRTLLPWLGEGLLVAGGERWARSRRLLTPAFHFDILKPYVNIANEAVDTMLTKIDKHVEHGTSFDLFSMISLCTFEILHRCALSVNDDIQLQGNSHPYVNAVNELLDTTLLKNFTPIYFFDWIFYNTEKGKRFKKNCDYVHKYAEDIINKRRITLEQEGPPTHRYLDFLDVLLSAIDKDGKGLTPLEIRNEVDTFLFEGFDTTTSGISWTLHTLATRPDIQTTLQTELDSVLASRTSKHITWDDIPKLEYLSRCLKEGLRFHSPVPYVSRSLTKDMAIGNTVIPSGTTIALAIWNIHHNPDVWDEPELFDPDRFLPENFRKKDSFAFMPFSAGPRNCIGQNFALNEERVVVGRVIERFQITPDLSHEVGRKVAGVMKSTGGLWVFAKHRHKNI